MSEILTITDLEKIKSSGQPTLLFFYAQWQEEALLKDLQEAIAALSQKFPTVLVHSLEAEQNAEVSGLFQLSLVPSYFALHGQSMLGKVEGANPSALMKLVKQLSILKTEPTVVATSSSTPVDITLRLVTLINTSPVMLFMKGSPATPKCGFSRQICEILHEHNIPFASFDILTDEEVRSGLKTHSDWPTYPQLYVNGEFVGGLDILKELAASGNMKTELGIDQLILPPSAPSSLEEKLKTLINMGTIMLFMKGSPAAPKCGFSRTIVEMLREENIEFSFFDILTDDGIREGLKKYSDWPTYPQLYAKGELIGGLDIVKEMKGTGPLLPQLME